MAPAPCGTAALVSFLGDEIFQNGASRTEKVKQIDTFSGEIEILVETIDDPETSFKAQIKEAEESLLSCVNSQKTQTKERTEASLHLRWQH